jgi:hypothetical protein
MSRRAVACVAACALIAACSLTDTSGLSDGPSGAPDAGDAAVLDAVAEAPLDAPADTGPDAAKDPTLLAEYSFEDPVGSTTVKDTSGNEKHGSLQSGATLVTDGVRGHALSVGGAGFFVVDALGGTLFPRSGTLSLWFRFDFAPTDMTGRSVFDNWDKNRSHLFVRFPDGNSTPGQFQMALQPATLPGGYAAVVNFTPQRNKWTHVVVTWDENIQVGAFFVDGVSLGQIAYDQAFVPTAQLFRIGEGLVGGIDEVRVFRRALTNAEAVALD